MEMFLLAILKNTFLLYVLTKPIDIVLFSFILPLFEQDCDPTNNATRAITSINCTFSLRFAY